MDTVPFKITVSAGYKQAKPYYLHEPLRGLVLVASTRKIKNAPGGLQIA